MGDGGTHALLQRESERHTLWQVSLQISFMPLCALKPTGICQVLDKPIEASAPTVTALNSPAVLAHS